MVETLLIICIVLLLVCLAMLAFSLRRKVKVDLAPMLAEMARVDQSYQRLEKAVRDEIAQNRQELTGSLKGVGDSLNQQIALLTQSNDQRLEKVRETLELRLQAIQAESSARMELVRQDAQTASKALREEVAATLKAFGEVNLQAINDLGGGQRTQLGNVIEQLTRLTDTNEKKLDALRIAVEDKLRQIHEDNAKQLDQMRATVDEKLQGTLEKRLGESFKQVSDRLEAVYKGLGEMQTLASGVGDLKKVLTNVKTRGTWGEVQLGAMLEQILTPDQYATNVAVKDNGERVEFAIKLPGRGEDRDQIVWLPIDAKFPVEDYQRLLDAQEKGDATAAEEAAKQLEIRIKFCAAEICEKYIAPPATTDFGILFLPTEGLFAEVIRRTGLGEYVQRECRVVIAGPTTLWSILNSLQMGFRTLAIQKRSGEVWDLLSAVKTEWSKYGEVLSRVQKKLQEASNTIDDAATRARVVGRKLKQVQELPADQADSLLFLDSSTDSENP